MHERRIYFNEGGGEMRPEYFHKVYPCRKELRSTVWVRGIKPRAVLTQFVGINHNPSIDGKPWIYETCVVHGGEFVRVGLWTSSRRRALLMHRWAVAFVMLGGVAWWRSFYGMAFRELWVPDARKRLAVVRAWFMEKIDPTPKAELAVTEDDEGSDEAWP